MVTVELRTYQKCAMINITKQVKDAVAKSGVKDGIVTVHCPHTTAGITVNENADPDVVTDLLAAMEALVPKLDYRHAEGNSPAHLKAALTGCSAVVPVKDGEPALGVWQGIYFCEYDGPRSRRLFVQVIG